MNITILTLRGPTKNGTRGGAREYIEEISKEWVSNGHKVNIVCGSEPPKELYESEEIEGVNVIRVGKTRWAMIDIIKYYKSNLEQKTDILIENIVSFPMFIPLIKKNKIKMLTIVHHLTDRKYFKTHNILIASIGYIMEKLMMPLAYRKQEFIAVSKLTKSMLNCNGIKNELIHVVNPGITQGFFKPGKKSEKPLIFYIGRYNGKSGNKRVDHLIQAYKGIIDEIGECELVIAGKGECVEVLKEMSKGLNVKFIGMISDEEKRTYMQKAWIFASPSLAEGFGITWIEANACGTPVVAYNIEGLDTVDDKSGRLVSMGNIKELQNALKQLILDKELCKRLSSNGPINASKYSWKNTSEKIGGLIEQFYGRERVFND